MMEVKLIVANGSRKGQEIKITRDVFEIGKSPRCQLSPGGDGVGRHHCAIFRKEGYAAIKAVDPNEPTFINGKRVASAQKLKNGDVLKVGAMEFEIQLTVGVSGQKMSKVQSVSEAAARIVEKKQLQKSKAEAAGAKNDDDELDIFAIFGEEVPSEEDHLSFIARKNRQVAETVVKSSAEDDALAKEKKMQESTRSAAADAIKAMLNQARRGG
ncbi:MAG: FHA domain-containing protein [Planctomycetia bacterium]|nr:FHA domain-containing protein [Planctomycetia bacterium]